VSAADVDDAPPVVSVVRAPREHTLRRQLADQEADGRPDAGELVSRLIASVTDAVASVFGEQCRAGITVELVATPAGRTGVGGVLA
jgi:hypothetical protein